MTRISKKQKRRSLSPRKRKHPVFKKTGPKKEDFYKNHINAIESNEIFISKIKEFKNV